MRGPSEWANGGRKQADGRAEERLMSMRGMRRFLTGEGLAQVAPSRGRRVQLIVTRRGGGACRISTSGRGLKCGAAPLQAEWANVGIEKSQRGDGDADGLGSCWLQGTAARCGFDVGRGV